MSKEYGKSPLGNPRGFNNDDWKWVKDNFISKENVLEALDKVLDKQWSIQTAHKIKRDLKRELKIGDTNGSTGDV